MNEKTTTTRLRTNAKSSSGVSLHVQQGNNEETLDEAYEKNRKGSNYYATITTNKPKVVIPIVIFSAFGVLLWWWMLQKQQEDADFMGKNAVIIEEYKLMFMPVAKVGSTLIRRLLMRMVGNPDWCVLTKANPHKLEVNHFVMLGDLPKSKQYEIMTSQEWTRAIFVREPKQRALSAFTDKAFTGRKNGPAAWYMKELCCPKTPDAEVCMNSIQDFGYFLRTTQQYCKRDPHWRPMSSYIDKKWWPYINFVGYSEKLDQDFETLLKSLNSTMDGVNAWERFGTSGWDLKNGCNETSNDPTHFGQKVHHTKAANKGTSISDLDNLKQHYTPEIEELVETIYRQDFENPYFHFPPLKLFADENENPA